jgi:guanosine-3',5'-bis(diphosphate) 3'-pyrophosphohydrolase
VPSFGRPDATSSRVGNSPGLTLQIEHAGALSKEAKLVKLADKICNVRDMSQSPPVNWSPERRAEYFTWAKQVVDPMRGVSPILENLFDAALARRNDVPT